MRYTTLKEIKNLDNYAGVLVESILTLKLLRDLQLKAVNEGLLGDEGIALANITCDSLKHTYSAFQAMVRALVTILPNFEPEDLGQQILLDYKEEEEKKDDKPVDDK